MVLVFADCVDVGRGAARVSGGMKWEAGQAMPQYNRYGSYRTGATEQVDRGGSMAVGYAPTTDFGT